jgi:hypothetical protein
MIFMLLLFTCFLFRYGLNSPVKYQDPTGHIACDDCEGRDDALAASVLATIGTTIPSFRLGRPIHIAVEADFVQMAATNGWGAYGSDLPGGRQIFNIHGAGPSGGTGYPDAYYSKNLTAKGPTFINEIKPDTPNGLVTGAAQMDRYLSSCSNYCARGDWYGSTGERNVNVGGLLDINVRLVPETGVLAYKTELKKEALVGLTAAAALGLIVKAANGKANPAPQPQPNPAYLPSSNGGASITLSPRDNPLTINQTTISPGFMPALR